MFAFFHRIGKDHINYKPFRGLKYLPSPRRHLLSPRTAKTSPPPADQDGQDGQDVLSPSDVVAVEDVSPPPDCKDHDSEEEEDDEPKKVTKKTKSKSSRGRLLDRIKKKDRDKDKEEDEKKLLS